MGAPRVPLPSQIPNNPPKVRSLPFTGQPLWETVVACFAENPFAERNQKEAKDPGVS